MDHNAHNHRIYTENSSAAADFLAVNHQVQVALHHWIESLASDSSIRILELGSSSRPNRWQTISSLPTSHNWHVTLSDFTLDALPATALLPNTPSFYFSHKKIDLLRDPLPTTQYDFILATYVFDAIWFPQDMYINRINYPGGLISKIQQTFSSCLSDHGFFISIDHTSTRFVPEYELSGDAHFKTENYQLAKTDLEKLGFTVNLLSLNDLLTLAGETLPLDLSDHSVLTVSKTT